MKYNQLTQYILLTVNSATCDQGRPYYSGAGLPLRRHAGLCSDCAEICLRSSTEPMKLSCGLAKYLI
jgi:hypothetical protein